MNVHIACANKLEQGRQTRTFLDREMVKYRATMMGIVRAGNVCRRFRYFRTYRRVYHKIRNDVSERFLSHLQDL
jgi:hypothetical protein